MVLIFEDDVQFDERITTTKNVQKLAFFTKKLTNWNIIYLGHWSFLSLPTRFLNLHRDFTWAAHAYIISNQALEWLATTKYEDGIWFHKNKNSIGLGIDVFYTFVPRSYGFFPMMAYQSGTRSSNQRPHQIGKFIINLALSDPRYMKYNQYLIFLLSLVATIFILKRLGKLV